MRIQQDTEATRRHAPIHPSRLEATAAGNGCAAIFQRGGGRADAEEAALVTRAGHPASSNCQRLPCAETHLGIEKPSDQAELSRRMMMIRQLQALTEELEERLRDRSGPSARRHTMFSRYVHTLLSETTTAKYDQPPSDQDRRSAAKPRHRY